MVRPIKAMCYVSGVLLTMLHCMYCLLSFAIVLIKSVISQFSAGSGGVFLSSI